MSHSYHSSALNWELSFSQSLHSLFAQDTATATTASSSTQTMVYPSKQQSTMNMMQEQHHYSDQDDDNSSDDDHQDVHQSSVCSDQMDLHHANDFRSSSSLVNAAVSVSSPFSVPPILYSLFENLSCVASNDSKEFRADGVYKRHAPNLVRLKNVFSTAKFYPLYANQYDSEHDIQTIVAEVPIVIIRKSDFQETTAPSFVYSTVMGSNHSLRNISRTLAEYSLLPTKCSQKLPNYQSADQCDILIVCDWKKGDKQFKSVLNKHYTPAMVRKALIIFDKQIATPKIRGKCDFRPRADIRAIYSVNENYSNEEIYAKLQESENEQQIIDGRPCSACHQQKYFLCSNGDYECIHCKRFCMANEFFPSKSCSPVPSLSSDSDDSCSDDEKKIRGKKRRRSDENKPNKRAATTIVKPSSIITSINSDSFRLQHTNDEENHVHPPSLDLLHNSLPSLEAFGSVSPSIESLTVAANDHLLLHDLNSPFFFDPIGLSYSNAALSTEFSDHHSVDDDFLSF